MTLSRIGEGANIPSPILRICVLPFQGGSGKEDPWLILGVPYLISFGLSQLPSVRVLDEDETELISQKISERGGLTPDILTDIAVMGFVSSPGKEIIIEIGAIDRRKKEPFSIKYKVGKEDFHRFTEDLVSRIARWVGIPKEFTLKPLTKDPRALEDFFKGMALWMDGMEEDAIPNLENALKKDSYFWRAAALMARIYFSSGDIEKAEELLVSQLVRNEKEPELWLELGAFYHGKEDFEKSVSSYKKALELKNDLIPAYLGLGVALRRIGNIDGAISYLKDGLALDPRDREIRFNLATIYHLDKGMLDEAISHYNELLSTDPKDPSVLHNLGLALVDKGKKEEALSKMREALSIDPDNPHIMTSIGTVLESMGREDEAISMWKRALEVEEDFIPALICLGNYYSSKRSYREAEEVIRKILDIEPDPDLYIRLAMCIYLQGRKKEAAEELEKVAQEFESPDIYNLLGMIYKELGDKDKARDSYEKALIIDPDNLAAKEAINDLESGKITKREEVIEKGLFRMELRPEPIEMSREIRRYGFVQDEISLHANLALSYAAFGFLDRAREEAEKALRIDPSRWEARMALGNVLLASGDPQGALREYEKALQRKPLDPVILNNIGIALIRIGRSRDAIEVLRKALAVDPDMEDARLNLATAFFDSGNFADALSEYDLILRRGGENQEAIFNSALCLDALGKYEEALDRLNRYVEVGGVRAVAYNAMGNIYLKRNEVEKAIEFYKKAIEGEPYEPAIVNLALCYEKLGMKDEMRRWWKRYLELFPNGEGAGLAREKLKRGERQ